MRLPFRREEAVAVARFAVAFEVIALAIAGALGVVHAALARSAFIDAFLLWTFVLFLLVLMYAVLSGPGLFLSRPKFAAVGPGSRDRWRQWLAAPPVSGDREFYELVLYTGLAFLLLAAATGIGALARLLGG
ncbi:MAG: hypothetical protein AABY30_03670 [Candidatus Thermoplasmatota archaeon]